MPSTPYRSVYSNLKSQISNLKSPARRSGTSYLTPSTLASGTVYLTYLLSVYLTYTFRRSHAAAPHRAAASQQDDRARLGHRGRAAHRSGTRAAA